MGQFRRARPAGNGAPVYHRAGRVVDGGGRANSLPLGVTPSGAEGFRVVRRRTGRPVGGFRRRPEEIRVSDPKPSFFVRLWIAFVAPWRVLFSADFGAGVQRLMSGAPALPPPEAPKPEPEPEPEPPKPEPPRIERAPVDAALQLLALFQREGRFVDFLEEDVASFSDEEIGAAARVVHEGCRKAVREHFTLAPVKDDEEGTSIEVPKGFDAHTIRLTGNVVGEPPFRGTLQHRGWKATRAELPKLTEEHDVHVIAPAEVEL
ncbi:MAG: DUF2760 domain-containing protein [Myxococcales bacterium]|nr:DUF2760 domain-containing protein [Myxococcales bacterium]